MTKRILAAIAGILMVAGCSSNSSTGPDGNTGGATGTLTATVNGAPFSATFHTTATVTNNIVVVQGEEQAGGAYTYNLITIAIGNFSAPGTFSLALGNANGANALWTAGTADWSTALTGGTGTITVTAYNATHIAGTFSFTAVSSAGADNVVVTNGKFDVPF